jgi:HD-GYP domain-containing protein (c-di-GMP phosphodiesterase class II)
MSVARLQLVRSSPVPQTWVGTTHLNIGRLPELDVILDHTSVSRRHAEIFLAEEGWLIRDAGSTNGTYLNGARIGRMTQRLRQGDVIVVGEIELHVELLRELASKVKLNSGKVFRVEATTRRSWEEALDGFELSDQRWEDHGKAFVRLMRAGYRLAHSESPEDQLQEILDETAAFFRAQRAGLFLTDSTGSQLTLRLVASQEGRMAPLRTMSRTPSLRAITGRQSLLFKDCQGSPELQAAESVARGSMTSIICAVLRSPERIFGVLQLDRGFTQEPFSEEDLYLADSLTASLALGIDRVEMMERQQEIFLHTITALAQAVEMKDLYTGDHTHRVTAFSLLLAEELGLPANQRQILRAAAGLHDIGKIAIDDQVLRKPGRLSDLEYTQMKTHVTRGAEIIQMIPGLAWALPVVRGHHERWDGTGYPDRLRGEEIPLLARVVSVADAFDAMTSDRPYRRGMSIAEAYQEIKSASGQQFDPQCVDAFIRIRPKIESMQGRESELRKKAATGTETITGRELKRILTDTPSPTISISVEPPIANSHALANIESGEALLQGG